MSVETRTIDLTKEWPHAQVVREDERGERAERLLRSAERYCVILGTLRTGVPVECTFALEAL